MAVTTGFIASSPCFWAMAPTMNGKMAEPHWPNEAIHLPEGGREGGVSAGRGRRGGSADGGVLSRRVRERGTHPIAPPACDRGSSLVHAAIRSG